MTIDNATLLEVRRRAERLFSPAEIEIAVCRMADEITARIGTHQPLLLTLMTGGLVPTALLLPHLDFPLQVDYLHLTRYGQATTGGELSWLREPALPLAGRTVLLVDDLLDRGITLQAAVESCRARGAAEVLTAVLIHKEMPTRPGLERTDFAALRSPDRYLFGYGMDYKTYWRNAPGIFAAVDS